MIVGNAFGTKEINSSVYRALNIFVKIYDTSSKIDINNSDRLSKLSYYMRKAGEAYLLLPENIRNKIDSIYSEYYQKFNIKY
ncbi:hypothetical protein YN1_7870 [Nanoarchaeota archaeon]